MPAPSAIRHDLEALWPPGRQERSSTRSPYPALKTLDFHREVALFTAFHKLPRTDTPSKLLKTTKIMKLVLRKCCGKFAPVDRKGAALPLCPAPRSRDGRH